MGCLLRCALRPPASALSRAKDVRGKQSGAQADDLNRVSPHRRAVALSKSGGVAAALGLVSALAPVTGAEVPAAGGALVHQLEAETLGECGHHFAAFAGRKTINQKRNFFVDFKLIELVRHDGTLALLRALVKGFA